MSELRQPDPIRAVFGRLLESALNRALDLDADTKSDLRALEGRRIGVELRGLNLALAISVHEGRLRVGPHWDAPSDLNLHATPGSLLAFALRRGDDSALPPGKVAISGDAELARRVEKLMRGFKPDIEEAFSKTFGDVIGVPIARALHGAFEWSRDSAKAFVQNSAEYLREESRDLIAPAEMEQFLDDVDRVRDRTERLQSRFTRLSQRVRGDAA
jgi:ubiquinone biosynthesis accessory factor UbiJ